MKQILKRLVENISRNSLFGSWVTAIRLEKGLIEWKRDGRPVPPPHLVKQRTIRSLARKFKLKVLVETGTYHGDMVEAMKKYFDRIYSIELSDDLYKKAKNRFDDDDRIQIIYGDSGVQLGNLMSKITQPTLFWLDGHYSAGETARSTKDTPIIEELTHIFNGQKSRYIIMIDDARCFGSSLDYPSIEELSSFARMRSPNAKIEVKDDIIRIIPSVLDG